MTRLSSLFLAFVILTIFFSASVRAESADSHPVFVGCDGMREGCSMIGKDCYRGKDKEECADRGLNSCYRNVAGHEYLGCATTQRKCQQACRNCDGDYKPELCKEHQQRGDWACFEKN